MPILGAQHHQLTRAEQELLRACTELAFVALKQLPSVCTAALVPSMLAELTAPSTPASLVIACRDFLHLYFASNYSGFKEYYGESGCATDQQRSELACRVFAVMRSDAPHLRSLPGLAGFLTKAITPLEPVWPPPHAGHDVLVCAGLAPPTRA